jgi:hypothetical protein
MAASTAQLTKLVTTLIEKVDDLAKRALVKEADDSSRFDELRVSIASLAEKSKKTTTKASASAPKPAEVKPFAPQANIWFKSLYKRGDNFNGIISAKMLADFETYIETVEDIKALEGDQLRNKLATLFWNRYGMGTSTHKDPVFIEKIRSAWTVAKTEFNQKNKTPASKEEA